MLKLIYGAVTFWIASMVIAIYLPICILTWNWSVFTITYEIWCAKMEEQYFK